MGRRGPTPKPVKLKVLEGNPGKRPLPARPRAPSGRVTCPDWLSREAKVEWRRLAPRLQERGLLTPLDRAAFACYCLSYAHSRACLVTIDKQGSFYVTPGGRIVERPEMQMAKQYSQLMRTFAVEFGLTPNSRARCRCQTGSPATTASAAACPLICVDASYERTDND